MDLQSLKIERTAKPAPTGRGRRSPWPLRLGGLALLGGAAWLFAPSLSGFVDRMRLPTVRSYLITASSPAAAAAVRGTAANGYVVAARRAALSSDVPGRIVAMRVQEGSVVRKGEIVAQLFADEFRAALQRADADLTTAGRNVERTRAQALAVAADIAQAEANHRTAVAQASANQALLQFADLELGRLTALAQASFGTQRDADRARSERDAAAARQRANEAAVAAAATAVDATRQRGAVADAEIAVAMSQEQAAMAARALAQATLDKTDVRAPFDGIVVLKDAEVGEVVSPNVQGGSNARGAVCTMVDFDSLEVQANVPETTLASVRQGAPADVFLDAFPDDRLAGTVDRIWPTADRQKATVEVRIKLAQRDARLRPEMGVRIVFRAADAEAPTAPGAATRAVLVVPVEALVTIDGVTGAFVLERDTVRFTAVTAGERKAGRVAVDAGLAKDQRIVLDPPASLRSGDRVRVQDN